MFEGNLNRPVFRLDPVMLCVIITNYTDNISSKTQKRQSLIIFVFVNTIQYPHTLKNNMYHSNDRGRPPFFNWDTNHVLGHVLVYSVGKTHVLVVTGELIWLLFLNIRSFNFVPTLNKCFRFTRFRRSYVNLPAIVLIKVTLHFYLICAVQSCHVPFFVAVCRQ